MKKGFIIAVLMFFAFVNLEAQVTFKPGFRGGLNFSNITETDADYKADFYIGVLGELKISKHYTLQPEIVYSKQGADNAMISYYDYDTSTSITKNENISINYLSLGVINKFTIVKGFNVMVGPTIDFVVGDNLIKRESDMDLAITAGFGYSLPSGLAIELRFKKGMADVLDSDYYDGGDGFFFGDYNTNILFQVGASYTFDLK